MAVAGTSEFFYHGRSLRVRLALLARLHAQPGKATLTDNSPGGGLGCDPVSPLAAGKEEGRTQRKFRRTTVVESFGCFFWFSPSIRGRALFLSHLLEPHPEPEHLFAFSGFGRTLWNTIRRALRPDGNPLVK